MEILRTEGLYKTYNEGTDLEVRALKPLQAAGWVIAGRADSGRAFDVTLSPSGVAKVAEAVPLWENAQAAFEREVGQDRAVRMRDEILELNLGG
jgi:hypothetical protein